MVYTGILLKMRAVPSNPIAYYLNLDSHEIHINDILNKPVTIRFLNKIYCIRCGRKILKSFAQGYCYPCFLSAPEAEECVLRPELCRAHEGIARDMDYARNHCLIDHFVYLAYTNHVKVGVTRHTQIPTRWIDQGALTAIILAKTPDRYTAGTLEVFLKNHFADKTQWQRMLKTTVADIDLSQVKKDVIQLLPEHFKKYITPETDPVALYYPLISATGKIKSISLDNTLLISDILIGIKGQYLIFNEGVVLNVRKHSGYLVQLEY